MSAVKLSSGFAALGLQEWLVQTCDQMGLRQPTDIQTQCIPKVLAGQDILGRAKTGSGKTAAFALPILQHLAEDPFGVFAMVLTPTRELAYQIAEQFRAFGVSIGLKEAVVVGGIDMVSQAVVISARPHIIIGTPGRIADHIRSGTELHLSHLQYLVFDEADRLFEPCFAQDIETILNAVPDPEKRRTLMFSATLTKALEQVQSMALRNAAYCDSSHSQFATVDQLDQKYIFVPQHVKECYLAYILMETSYKDTSAIVFSSTRFGCELISELLTVLGVVNVSLHSGKNQARRMASLGKFKSGAVKVLVATDVASRGLDIPTVQLVVNYDIPRVTEDYVHRVGRTARAGRGGLALTLVSQYDVAIFKQIEELIGKQLQEFPCKEDTVLQLLKKTTAAKKMASLHLEEFQLRDKATARRGGKRSGGDGADDDGGGDGMVVDEEHKQAGSKGKRPRASASAAAHKVDGSSRNSSTVKSKPETGVSRKASPAPPVKRARGQTSDRA